MDRKWLKSLIANMIIISILPVRISIYENGFGVDAVMYHVGLGSISIDPPLYIFTAVFVGIAILPAVLFSYIVHHRPIEKSVKASFLAAFILENPLFQFVAINYLFPPPVILDTPSYYGLYLAATMAIVASTWALVFLVVMPFLRRESSKIVITLRESQRDENVSNPKGRIYHLISIVLTLGTFLMPAVIGLDQPYYMENYYWIILVSGSAFLQINSTPYNPSINFFTLTGYYFPLTFVTTCLYITYAYDILQYLSGKRSKKRCIAMGLLATISAPLLTGMLSLAISIGGQYWPLPITFVIGLVILLRVKPIEVTDYIWKDYHDSKWYEQERVPEGARIKIPLHYLIRSKLSRSKKEQFTYEWNQRDEDAFGNQ